jgi:hypothetical protein
LAVAILMGSGAMMAVAQPDPGPASTPAPGQAQAGAAAGEAQGARALTIVPTELMGKIDTKKASVGQAITTIVSHPVTLADGTELPKGTKVMGHVVQVKAHSKEDPGSVLGLAFDSAVIKGGKTIALRTAIRNVAPPAGMGAGGGGAPMAGGGGGGGGGMGGGGGAGMPDGGGMGGPDVSASGRGGVSATGGAPPTGGARGGPPMGGGPMGMGGGTNGTAAAKIPAGARRTMLPGVLLSAPQVAGGSGTLTEAMDNVSIGDETQIVLVVMVAK